MKQLVVGLAMVLGLVACLSDDEGEDTYSNHVMLTCNGSVLVDRTFTSRTECEAYKANNTFMCAGVNLTITC